MSAVNDIKKAIKGITETGEEVYSILCTVISVDLTAKTCYCTPVSGDADISDVSLIMNAATGFMIIPTVDSIVMVTMQNKETGYVGMFSSVDSILLNGDAYGGLIKIADLVTKLNTIENDLNTIKTAFSSWVVVPNDGGAALKTIAAAWYGAQITPTTQVSIENTTVKHGNGI